jgi:hypothetical protein
LKELDSSKHLAANIIDLNSKKGLTSEISNNTTIANLSIKVLACVALNAEI